MWGMLIIRFLESYNYDIRKSRDARWIDQKCTCDVLSIVADCILEYTNRDTCVDFSISGIWRSQYTNRNVLAIFSKPDTNSGFARNEYDKFFSQPINLFRYSRILNFECKHGNTSIFRINNLELLEFIATRDINALLFLQLYIEKVLRDSELWLSFEKFFRDQNGESFKFLKEKFVEFTIQNTEINGRVECSRIFTKILNPIAFQYRKKGTRKGYISETIITFDEIKYNRINWRDEHSGKDKFLTRQEYDQEYDQVNFVLQRKIIYDIQKAKRIVRRYNDQFNSGVSEVKQQGENFQATQIHHIFPVKEFPTISGYIENLIALTPNQHLLFAHPDNQTNYIDRSFQYTCLLAKTDTIHLDYAHNNLNTYDFNQYKFVLNVGLNTRDFDFVQDYDTLKSKIAYFYSDILGSANLNR